MNLLSPLLLAMTLWQQTTPIPAKDTMSVVVRGIGRVPSTLMRTPGGIVKSRNQILYARTRTMAKNHLALFANGSEFVASYDAKGKLKTFKLKNPPPVKGARLGFKEPRGRSLGGNPRLLADGASVRELYYTFLLPPPKHLKTSGYEETLRIEGTGSGPREWVRKGLKGAFRLVADKEIKKRWPQLKKRPSPAKGRVFLMGFKNTQLTPKGLAFTISVKVLLENPKTP